MIFIYFDGLTEPVNPRGIATYGYTISENNSITVKEGYGLATEPWSPNATNNVAEYMGVICALSKAVELGIHSARVRGDSKLVISQLLGTYKVKSRRLFPLYIRARELAGKMGSVEFEWVPRELNSRADALSRLAYHMFVAGKLKYPGNQCF